MSKEVDKDFRNKVVKAIQNCEIDSKLDSGDKDRLIGAVIRSCEDHIVKEKKGVNALRKLRMFIMEKKSEADEIGRNLDDLYFLLDEMLDVSVIVDNYVAFPDKKVDDLRSMMESLGELYETEH